MDTALSIIIPAYNEQDRIITTLTHTINFLQQQSFKSQILVVSDGSNDNTEAVVNRFASTKSINVQVMTYSPNRGKGYAVKYGMQYGQGQVMMFMDADYAVPIEYCLDGLALMNKGYDIAIASRAIEGAQIKTHQNTMRSVSAKIYTFIQNHYLGLHYPDTQCGFKFFSQKAAKDLFPRQKLTSVIFDPEILWLAKKRGYTVAQFPVQWSHIADSRIQYDSLRKSLFVFQELFRIKKIHRNEL